MKLKSFLPRYPAFFVRISIYALTLYIVYILLSVWSHTVSGLIGAAAILITPVLLCFLILHLGAYFANSGVLCILLAIIYGFLFISSLPSLADGDIKVQNFLPIIIFTFYGLAFSFIFAYSAYYLVTLKGKNSVQ